MHQTSQVTSPPISPCFLAKNELWQYIKRLHPDIVDQLSQPDLCIYKVIENYLASVLGILPHSEFDVMIQPNREALGKLSTSAMMYGYFLNKSDHQMKLEQSWQEIL